VKYRGSSLVHGSFLLKGAGMKLDRKLKMGMIGGGPGAFIGEVHRKAARMDGGIELVAGAFDINPRKSKQMGRELCLNPKRVYRTYEEMIERELKLPEGERVDFVSVTTPNNWHFPIARDFLKVGFHVMCEKPMTFNVKEARELRKIVKRSRKVFGLMHNYTGYPMVKLARDMVRRFARLWCSIHRAGWPHRWREPAICRPRGAPTPSKAAAPAVWVISAHTLRTCPNTLQG
jgi:predicted dehydrogenase